VPQLSLQVTLNRTLTVLNLSVSIPCLISLSSMIKVVFKLAKCTAMSRMKVAALGKATLGYANRIGSIRRGGSTCCIR